MNIRKVLNYLRYPSTYQGIVAVVCAVLGTTIAPEQVEAIAAAGVTIYGLIDVFFSDADVKPSE